MLIHSRSGKLRLWAAQPGAIGVWLKAGFELPRKGRRSGRHSPSWPAGLRLVPCLRDCAGAGPVAPVPEAPRCPSPPLDGRTSPALSVLPLSFRPPALGRCRCSVLGAHPSVLASPPPCSARARCGCGVSCCGAPPGAQAPPAAGKGECPPPAGGKEGHPRNGLGSSWDSLQLPGKTVSLSGPNPCPVSSGQL